MQVMSTRVINDRDTGVSRGYGFVNMADVHSAQAAMRSLDNYKVASGRLLTCVRVEVALACASWRGRQ